ncbi:Pyruvate/2-oxoglutarate dehydrogenase complex, dihydrolipoamide dehydrogenase (E3) component [Ruaniaceae bacterium KH17]|nr:Pyruvate/2-oxoglutarate dehydrogenase complex, dihydrolipoamide dehydrogenase (E3) component [Ruaniaceae bacterium KH17]
MTHVLILGAGPAGLAAARAARSRGARVTLVDSADAVGGQYWRHLPEQRAGANEESLHHGWDRFTALRQELEADGDVRLMHSTSVWAIDRDGEGALRVHATEGPADGPGREPHTLSADAIVLATGAHDRTLPFPGWTLPGVFTAGAAQALAKSERIAVGRNVVVAGAGPFLFPVAASLSQVGANVVGVFEAARGGSMAKGWLPRPWSLLRASHKAGELVQYVSNHVRNRIPYTLGSAVIAAHGTAHVAAVTIADLDTNWAPIPGSERRIAVDAVCVSHGFTPRVELAVAAGCELTSERFVVTDERLESTVPGVFAAGEITGIGGVDASLVEGEIAGLAAAGLTAIPTKLRRRHRATTDFARRIEAAHGIRSGWTSWLTDATVVCRCESVTAGAIDAATAASEQDALRSVKLTTRAGLGVCQARICGRTLEQLIGTHPGGGIVDNRPIASPIRLGELAAASTLSRTEHENTTLIEKESPHE